MVLVWLVFRKELMDGCERKGRFWFCERSKTIDAEKAILEIDPRPVHRSVYLVLGTLVLVFVGFVLSPYIGLPLAMVAFIGGAFVLMFLPFFNRSVQPVEVLRKVDWTLLLFFVGSVRRAQGSGDVRTAGGDDEHVPGQQRFRPDQHPRADRVQCHSLQPDQQRSGGHAALPVRGQRGQQQPLAGPGHEFHAGGERHHPGAAANVIVVETGNKMGVEVSLWQFMKAGLPITIITLLFRSGPLR